MSQPKMARVITSRPFIGICHMQVCCVPDATDEEVLAHCNAYNPSGTEAGWSAVQRDPTSEGAPVSCNDYPTRVHLVVSC